MIRWLIVFLALALGALGSVPAAWAQSSSKPIRLIVPYPPGGGGDTLSRMLGQKLAEIAGVPVIVDNRPGAGGMIGTELAARAEPDGNTLVLGTPAPLTVAPSIHRKMPYDAARDLAPVTLITVEPGVVLVKPTLPVHSIDELLAMARARPGQLTYGSSGIGGTGHLSALMLENLANIKMLHVPYKGTEPALTALLSGEITLMVSDMGAALPQIRAGTLRALAVTSDKRSPALPDVPAVAESVPGYSAGPFYGILAPAGTPAAMIETRRDQIARALHTPQLSNRIHADGGEVIASTPQVFAHLMKEETQRWAKVLKAANVPME